ncbi:hypothetical protein A2U01_0106294, partial [Trifolium medium]|nr:hypothetical protein [Trifolium medium]
LDPTPEGGLRTLLSDFPVIVPSSSSEEEALG